MARRVKFSTKIQHQSLHNSLSFVIFSFIGRENELVSYYQFLCKCCLVVCQYSSYMEIFLATSLNSLEFVTHFYPPKNHFSWIQKSYNIISNNRRETNSIAYTAHVSNISIRSTNNDIVNIYIFRLYRYTCMELCVVINRKLHFSS